MVEQLQCCGTLAEIAVGRYKGVPGVVVFEGRRVESGASGLHGVAFGVELDETIGEKRGEDESCFDEMGVEECSKFEVFGENELVNDG